MIIDCLLDALHDSIKLVPFLLLTYFLMEELEHHTGGKAQQRIIQKQLEFNNVSSALSWLTPA